MSSNYTGTPVADHTGRIFPSQKDMCDYYGIKAVTFLTRIKRGFSLKDALTTPVGKAIEFRGKKYNSLKTLAEEYNIIPSSLSYRINAGGKSLEEAIDTLPRDFAITDHLGNKYPSKRAMCRKYGISLATFLERENKGWPLEKILTNPKKRGVGVSDHQGNHFSSIDELCSYYELPKKMYFHRKARGWDIEKILTTPANHLLLQHGETRRQRVGLLCTYLVEEGEEYLLFEDGIKIPIGGKKGCFRQGTVSHPNLHLRKRSIFHGFDVRVGKTVEDNFAWYKCTCRICGKSYVQTPQFMIAHHKSHTEQGEKP